MVDRTRLLNLKVSDEELAKLKAIADADEEPMAVIVRRWIKNFYRERFGNVAPGPVSPTRGRK